MKKITKLVAVLMVATMVLTLAPMTSTNAATKKTKVTYKLKKGTLTIAGKGAMSSKKTFKSSKIKKVVIKKGVTSISKNAFAKCKNLKTVSISSSVKTIGIKAFANTAITKVKVPTSVKTIGQYAFGNCKKLKSITVPGKFTVSYEDADESSPVIAGGVNLENVYFSTSLNLASVASFRTDNLNVSNTDKNYKSIGGVIYTKNGSGIVRVPANRSTVTLENGCTTFNLQAVEYGYKDDGDDFALCKISKIVLPSSVNVINRGSYYALAAEELNCKDTTILFNNNKFSDDSLENLYRGTYDFDIDLLAKTFPDKIKESDGMYITTNGLLLEDKNDKETITIPNTVKIIGEGVYRSKQNVKKVVIPTTVNEIRNYAFAYSEIEDVALPESVKKIGDGIFVNTQISEVKLPTAITEIPNNMYYGTPITKVDIPNNIKAIGMNAFGQCTSLKEVNIGTGLTTIKTQAFYGNGLEKIKIPANVTTIEKYAFSDSPELKKVEIVGKSAGITTSAFSGDNSAVIYYTNEAATNYKTFLQVTRRVKKSKTKAKVYFQWIKVADADGYQVKLCTSKKFKKNVTTKTYKAGSYNGSATVKNKKQVEYVRVRTYKIVSGKRVYGQWYTDKL